MIKIHQVEDTSHICIRYSRIKVKESIREGGIKEPGFSCISIKNKKSANRFCWFDLLFNSVIGSYIEYLLLILNFLYFYVFLLLRNKMSQIGRWPTGG